MNSDDTRFGAELIENNSVNKSVDKSANKKFVPGTVTVYEKPAELAEVTRTLRLAGRKLALVPTMGALHAGHLDLIRRAKKAQRAIVVVSIFVNPLQFGAGEDLDSYPRQLSADIEKCAGAGAELVFAPTVRDMYPNGGNDITVCPGKLADELEGASRPGHFAGVLTVVTKLLNIVRPDYAFFGEKDYQQLVLIKQLVRELNMDSRIVGVPTVRESDGLALSSRNAYLNTRQRQSAVALSAALTAGAQAGAHGGHAVLAAAHEVLASTPDIELDYLELRSPELAAAPENGEARLLIAAKVGNTRIIDNIAVHLGVN